MKKKLKSETSGKSEKTQVKLSTMSNVADYDMQIELTTTCQIDPTTILSWWFDTEFCFH